MTVDTIDDAIVSVADGVDSIWIGISDGDDELEQGVTPVAARVLAAELVRLADAIEARK